MNVSPNPDISSFFGNVITSYHHRIRKIRTAFESSENISESSHAFFDHVHNSLPGLRKERGILISGLSETLETSVSVRKKDYNTMISDLLSALDVKEQPPESGFLVFLEARKGTVQTLTISLLGIKDIAAQDAGEKITAIRAQLSSIPKLPEGRKDQVMKTFTNFQQRQNGMIKCLESLIEKGDHILIRDIKKG